MQRRKVDPSGNGAVGTPEAALTGSAFEKKSRSTRSTRTRPNRLLVVLLATAALFALGTILFPKELRQVEDTTAKTTKDIVNNAYRVEQQMEGWFIDQKQFDGKDVDATAAMVNQQSSWVDGEKKLKQQLKVLADRQEKGIDVGVPVLTRYLGEDFPAWAGKDVDEQEWSDKVKAKYAEMAAEEERWKARVRMVMEQDARKAR